MDKDGPPEGDPPDIQGIVRKRLLGAVEDLHGLGITDLLQARAIACLIGGRRTVAEMVEEIYGFRNPDPGYMSSYSKTRRAVRELESKGYVTTRLLGRDKPYRLTSYALSNLSGLGTHSRPSRLVPRKDIVAHLASALLLSTAILILANRIEIAEAHVAPFYAAFFTLLGVSITRLLETISRVT